MALAQQITVGPAGTAVAGPTFSGGLRVRVRNGATTTSVYVGGNENTALSSTTGITLGPQTVYEFTLSETDGLLVYASVSQTVEVFRCGGTRVG